MRHTIGPLLLTFALLVYFAVHAGEKSAPNVSNTDAVNGQSAIWLTVTSINLFELGIQESDPYLVLTAANLRKRANLRWDSSTFVRQGVDIPTKPAEPILVNWQKMLEVAVTMSRGDETIAGLAEDIRVQRSKGVLNGAVYSEAIIMARGKHSYSNLPFEGGQFAEVFSIARKKTNLDMFIYDGNGHMVCSQTDPSNTSQCGWTPSFTGPFTIVVENKSDVSTAYALSTN